MRCSLPVVALIFVLLSTSLTAFASEAAESTDGYQAVIGTQEGLVPASVGDVIGRGSASTTIMNGKQYDACELPQASIGGRGTAEITERVEIRVEVTDDCVMILESVTKREARDDSSIGMTASGSDFRSAASEYEDCCWLPLTTVWAEMTWHWNGSTVDWVSPYDAGWIVFPDGWGNNWFDWDLYLSSAANIWAEGNFDWFFGSYNHTHRVTLWGYGDGSWFHMCFTSGGTVPAGKWVCSVDP